MKEQKKKSKSIVTRFFETIELALGAVWIAPVIAYQGIKEHFEKKREEKHPSLRNPLAADGTGEEGPGREERRG